MKIVSYILFAISSIGLLGAIGALSKKETNDRASVIKSGSIIFLIFLIAGLWIMPNETEKPEPAKTDTSQINKDSLTLGQKLTVLDKRKILPSDDEYVVQETNLLELLSNKYKEPQDTIAEWTSKARGILHDQGIEDYTLNIMREVNKSPKMDNTKYKDVVTLYAYVKSKQ